MTNALPAAMPSRNGRRYGEWRVVGSVTPFAVSVLPVALPRPGKCLTLVSTPAAFMPRTNADTRDPTCAGVYPYSRSYRPIGWFLRAFFLGTTSATGARSRFTPAARSWPAHACARDRSVAALRRPCFSAVGIREKPEPVRRWTWPPSWSTDTNGCAPSYVDEPRTLVTTART